MYKPSSTYRIQFNKDFTFSDLENIIPYLVKLGIGAVYASPVFKAVPGSMHGYDVTDAHQINPEIGTEEQLLRISQQLKKYNIGWIQDIVPNHMAFHQDNKWLMDVLENGKDSAYASYFDILPDQGKLMVPFLGNSLDEAITNKEITIDEADGKFVLSASGQRYPLNQQSVKDHNLQSETLSRFNADAVQLKELIDAQHYELCCWQETDHRINYRRFFTVNGLICLNMNDERVFDHYHSYIKKLLELNVFDGLRVDHVDGLENPALYLERLRHLAGDDRYICVEKILHYNEKHERWPIEGNSGYDFLAMVNKLLTSSKNEKRLTDFYNELSHQNSLIQQQIEEKKSLILYSHMNGELNNLYELFSRLFPQQSASAQKESLKRTIGEMLVMFPVYRYYFNSFPLNKRDTGKLKDLFSKLRSVKNDQQHGSSWNESVNVFESVLLDQSSNEKHHSNVSFFFNRLMQFSGPLMAKGVEDTLMYTYNRFVAHNEVGDSPETFSLPLNGFHEKMIERKKNWPFSINATSTHDTKRGEDVRARLNVISETANEWIKQVNQWKKINEDLKQDNVPDANDEYLIYQSIVGLSRQKDDDKNRVKEYVTKALREAKTHSNWNKPDEQYEQQTLLFIDAIFNNHRFVSGLESFIKHIDKAAATNSLSQQLLKFTCPGIPDVYQGTELEDFSLVDPDNRRKVDYKLRADALDHDQFNKIHLTKMLMHERRNNPGVFNHGNYIPLKVEGEFAEHIIAFARRFKNDWYITIAPVHILQVISEQEKDVINWQDTRVVLPEYAPHSWRNVMTDNEHKLGDHILLNDVLKETTVALLKSADKPGSRAAGVLMHITSLPSDYGIGDFGDEARAFADALDRSKQKYWQLLPLNPTNEESCYSPYSTISSIAGNFMLISPELLKEDDLLDQETLNRYSTIPKDKVDYERVNLVKHEITHMAWINFKANKPAELTSLFDKFCIDEQQWLDDFSLYAILREQHDHTCWTSWPDEYKNRSETALKVFAETHHDKIMQVKFRQFLFYRQWNQLKEYCNTNGIKLVGDLPFYMNIDSVDVWMNRDIFNIDDNGIIKGIAGVPPDYFSEDGQLWGMPVYNWDVLKAEKYDWWITRLRRNLELFDVVRLDHFRAFESYWEVKEGSETAKDGEWKDGPREDFFNATKEAFPQMPFIAEDLGDNMDAVYEFRKKVDLPGMKVLQFAFGENMATAVDAPHNFTKQFFVYTGTHDNNTTLGWFNNELKEEDHDRIKRYTGIKPDHNNINEIMMRVAYSSIAEVAIIPIQDILKLDEKSRMNTPGTTEDNWLWRMLPEQLTEGHEKVLREMVDTFGR